MKKTAVAVAAAAAAVALVLSGCTSGGGGGGADNGDKNKVTDLKIGNFLPVTNWDPAGADIGFDGPYLSAVYDPLVRIDQDGKPTPALATKWEYNDDKTVLTMDLRTDAKFSDGEKFDADAAVAGLEHLRNGTTSVEAYLNVKAIEKVDDDTIKITLNKRDDTMLYLMGTGRSWMAAPKAIAADTLSKEPVGSGPYTLDASKTTPGSKWVFTKVKDHWAGDLFPFKSLEIGAFLDATARQNAMIAGQTNLTYGQATDIQQAKDKGWNIAEKVGSWVGISFTDQAGKIEPALGDVRVRQAINYAFDGTAILKSIANGVGVDTTQVFPADGPVNDKSLDKMYAFNIEKAKKLMAEAGYADGFTIKMPMSPVFQTWQAVAEQGLGQIGIKVQWDDMQQPDYQVNGPSYAMFIVVIAMDSDPATTVARQLANNQWYSPHAVENLATVPELKELVDKAMTAEGKDQIEAIKKVNEKATELAWFDVWYQGMNIYFSVPGIKVTPVTGQMFPTLDLIKQG